MSFKNRTVAVIGAAGGVGGALCRRLAVDGANLVLIGRRQQPLETIAAETGGAPLVADATLVEELEEALAGMDKLYGVVNCAGSLLLKPAHATSMAEWDHTIASNLTTAFAAVRAAVKAFGSRGGSIVLLSSAAARIGLSNSPKNG